MGGLLSCAPNPLQVSPDEGSAMPTAASPFSATMPSAGRSSIRPSRLVISLRTITRRRFLRDETVMVSVSLRRQARCRELTTTRLPLTPTERSRLPAISGARPTRRLPARLRSRPWAMRVSRVAFLPPEVTIHLRRLARVRWLSVGPPPPISVRLTLAQEPRASAISELSTLVPSPPSLLAEERSTTPVQPRPGAAACS